MRIFNRLICLLFGHRYFVEVRLNHWTRKLGCRRCGSHFVMNDDARCVLPWDNDFEQLLKDPINANKR